MKSSPLALIASLVLCLPASAATLGPKFQVVDLGSGYQLQDNPDGSVTRVTGSDGGPSYDFEKTPTSTVDIREDSKGFGFAVPKVGQWEYGQLRLGSYIQGTLQNGSLIQGYFSENISGGATAHVPLGFSLMNSWHNEKASPVSDMNASGAIVGTSSLYPSPMYRPETYAAFSTPDGKPHDRTSQAMSDVSDNLNNYIISSFPINLTQSFKIDDLGRIIARGTVSGQTHDFLLVPVGLSADPIPTPEPSTFALIASVAAGCCIRRFARKVRAS